MSPVSTAEQNGAAMTLSWVVEGKRYEIEVMDLNGLEWRDMKRETGLSEANLLRGALLEPADIEAVAAFVWVWRRREQPKLAYDDVLRTINLRVLIPEDAEEPAGDEAPTDPPG